MQSGPKLITIANLKSEKNLFALLKAFKKISLETELCAKLLIVGSGPQEHELKELSKHLKIDEHVIFSGLIINPYPYLDKADVFILSSDFEAFGIVILEAMSLGKTIVSTESEGPREIINHSSLGYLCKINDPNDLADKTIKAFSPQIKMMSLQDLRTLQLKKLVQFTKNSSGQRLRNLKITGEYLSGLY